MAVAEFARPEHKASLCVFRLRDRILTSAPSYLHVDSRWLVWAISVARSSMLCNIVLFNQMVASEATRQCLLLTERRRSAQIRVEVLTKPQSEPHTPLNGPLPLQNRRSAEPHAHRT